MPARGPETVLIDGYNLIFAWDELKELAGERLDLAREKLMDMLSGYAGFTGKRVVLVFDGFRTPGNPGSKSEYHKISVAFTKDGETGDAYIERIVSEIETNKGRQFDPQVADVMLGLIRDGRIAVGE